MTENKKTEIYLKDDTPLEDHTKDAVSYFLTARGISKLEKDLKKLERLEKAIEILKKHMAIYLYSFTNEFYFNDSSVTQEEYELLKEALKK